MTDELSNEEAAAILAQQHADLKGTGRYIMITEALRMGAEALRALADIPYEAISATVNDAMSSAVEHGANSVSMPDDYVAVVAWLCGIAPQPQGDSDER